MGFWSDLLSKGKTNKGTTDNARPLQGLNTAYPYYTEKDVLQVIWDSDLAYQCIDRICSEVAKIIPMHVVSKNGSETAQNDDVQRVLNQFNPIMSTYDAINKIVYNLYAKSNSWIYPVFEYANGQKKLKYLYPISPTNAHFKESNGAIFVELFFKNPNTETYSYTFRYDTLIHLRRQFYYDEMMGTLNELPLLNNMKINSELVAGIQKGVEASHQVSGVVQYGTALSQKLLEDNVKRFEGQLKKSESGILGLDNQSTYREIKKDPKLVDEATLEFTQKLVTNHFNVSLPILNGVATKEEKAQWFDSCIVPILECMRQGFTNCIFSERERSIGHEIRLYNYDRLRFMSDSELNDASLILLNAGAVTINKLLQIYGLPPLGEEGNRRVQSLNYVDTNIVNEYQLESMKNTKKEGGNKNESGKTGKENG